jgi:dGTPase
VLAAYEGDHHRTRMTHSLEVSQMGRSVAIALRLNADLAEAVALAHDLGHPPFGHAGEEALDELMAGHGGFRHNAQGARIVDYLEEQHAGHGLNLVHTVRRSLLKGPVPEGFPLSPDLLPGAALPLEAQVVDACDKIAYLCHDLDDGLRARMFTAAEAGQLRLWQIAREAARSDLPTRVVSEMTALLIRDLIEECDRNLSAAEAAEATRTQTPRATEATMASETTLATHHAATTAAAATTGTPSDATVGDPAATTATPRIQHGKDVTVLSQEVLAFLRQRFYRSPRVLDVMQQGKQTIHRVFERFVADPESMPQWVRARIPRDGLRRAVCDYVAGMTDRFLMKQ